MLLELKLRNKGPRTINLGKKKKKKKTVMGDLEAVQVKRMNKSIISFLFQFRLY